MDLTHRWCFDREDNYIHIFDVLPLAAAVYIHIKLIQRKIQISGPIPRSSAACPPAGTAIAALLARRQPQNAPPLHTGWTNQQIVTEEYRTLWSVNNELGTYTPAAWIHVFKWRLSLWCQQQSQQSQRPLLSLARRGFSRARSGSVCKWLECA